MGITPAAAIAAAARNLLAHRAVSAALNAPADGADLSAWRVQTVGSDAEIDAAFAAERAAGGVLNVLLLTAPSDLLGPAVAQAVDASDGLYFPSWRLVDLAATTTPEQRRTMFRLAVAYGHEWGGCIETVWVEHGVALWPSGDPRMPGGIWPAPDHTTGTGRCRWTVLEDGSVAWEVWRGPRGLGSEPCEGLAAEATAATAAGRSALGEWCGREFRTRPRPEVRGPEVVLMGTTTPDGEETIFWHSPEAEQRHYDATPYF
jgi:hypothetical protein